MQEYKLVVRGISSSTRTDGTGNILVQNADEFASWLNTQYLNKGWEIQSTQLVKTIPADATNPPVYEFAYHLVRVLNTAAKEK